MCRRAIDVDGKPQCLPMLPHEAQARTSALGVRDLSTLPLADLSVDDLDTAELDRFRRLAAGGGDAILAELSNRDLLSALGLRSVEGVPALGAALLFGTADVLTTFAADTRCRISSSRRTRCRPSQRDPARPAAASNARAC